jgi:large subunit ribosomal protein L22
MATRVKEKAAARKELADKRPRAVAKYLRISSIKARAVVDLIRGKQVDEALTILAMTPKSGSPMVEKVLKSAIANAENNLEMDRSGLYVAQVSADQGPALKRMRPGSRGQGKYYQHRTTHITVVLDQSSK